MRLKDKISIVTGAGSGIGRATAELFAEEGATLILADVTEAVEETAARIGPAAVPLRCDAGKEEDDGGEAVGGLMAESHPGVPWVRGDCNGYLAGEACFADSR